MDILLYAVIAVGVWLTPVMIYARRPVNTTYPMSEVGVFCITVSNNWGQSKSVMLDLPMARVTQRNFEAINALAVKQAKVGESSVGWYMTKMDLVAIREFGENDPARNHLGDKLQ